MTIDYPKHLAMMAERAKAPRSADAPTVISTFAGGGGSLTGYLMAGYKELLAVEWDENAVATLRLNYPDLDIYHGDIAKLSADHVLSRTGLKVGELDVLDGSPPCQGFSTAGKRDFADDRNQLFREYCRLLRAIQPKAFVMENVSGMVKGKMKLIFVEILKELKDCGYNVSARILNAKYFHVPQARQRMIFIGVRKDIGIMPSHPKAESGEIFASVIDGCPNTGFDSLFHKSGGELSDLLKMLKAGENMADLTMRLKGKPSGFTRSRVHPNMVAPTIMKGSICLFHYKEDRSLTVGELKRIGSFPDDYKFVGNFWRAQERIGNSVPPLFMEAIARHIRQNILL